MRYSTACLSAVLLAATAVLAAPTPKAAPGFYSSNILDLLAEIGTGEDVPELVSGGGDESGAYNYIDALDALSGTDVGQYLGFDDDFFAKRRSVSGVQKRKVGLDLSNRIETLGEILASFLAKRHSVSGVQKRMAGLVPSLLKGVGGLVGGLLGGRKRRPSLSTVEKRGEGRLLSFDLTDAQQTAFDKFMPKVTMATRDLSDVQKRQLDILSALAALFGASASGSADGSVSAGADTGLGDFVGDTFDSLESEITDLATDAASTALGTSLSANVGLSANTDTTPLAA